MAASCSSPIIDPSRSQESSLFRRFFSFHREKKTTGVASSVLDSREEIPFRDSKPYVRWWWLKGPYRQDDIRFQLDWVKSQGFGGVEIAWLRPDWLADSEDPILPPGISPKEKILILSVSIFAVLKLLKKGNQSCPLPSCGKFGCFEIFQEATCWACNQCQQRGDVIELTAKVKKISREKAVTWLTKKAKVPVGQQDVAEAKLAWLSDSFSKFMSFTKQEAEARDLGCDFTFGSGWPFGGSFLAEEDRSHTFESVSQQSINGSWEGYSIPVLNHLSAEALDHYSAIVGGGLKSCLQGRKSSLFCDSLELHKDRLWDIRLWEVFQQKFGYNLKDYLETIEIDPHVRYDYRKMISQTILQQFYRHFTEVCHQLGAFSRVQCHGAPTDLLAAYAVADIPESESLLFHPWFSRIPASSAVLANRPIVSCETFTCLYGFSREYRRKEQILDLKLLADALFANGVNQIIWHGMPYFDKEKTGEFYTTTHVGPDSTFIDDLRGFNDYLTQISEYMKMGQTYSGLAVYLPNEVMMMLGDLPEELRVPAAKDYWEMREVIFPKETEGYMPLWISAHFLEKANVVEKQLCVGEVKVPALYLDVDWLDSEALDQILRLAKEGLPIVLKRIPKQPGKIPSEGYPIKIEELRALPNVTDSFVGQSCQPLVEGEDLPYFWIRKDKGDYYLFFSHPETRHVRYPMSYKQSERAVKTTRDVTLNLDGHPIKMKLTFEPNESLMMKFTPGEEISYLHLIKLVRYSE